MTTQAMLPKEIDALRERVTQLENQLALQEQTVLVLQENEARLQSVLNNLMDAPYRRNLQTDSYDYLSPVIEQLTGWTVEEMNQADIETVLARIHPDDLPQVQQEIERTNRLCREVGRATGMLEYRFRTKTGDYCWLGDHLTVVAGDDGQPLYRLGVVRDISERKRVEKMQQQWVDAFANCTHGIAIGLPSSNQVFTCNAAFARLQGRTIDEIAGMSILSMYSPADHQYVKEMIMEADRTGKACYEAHMVRKDGSLYPVQMDVVSVRDTNGNLLYRVATQQDITERKRAEQTQQESLAKLERLFEILPVGISVLNHERQVVKQNPALENIVGMSAEGLARGDYHQRHYIRPDGTTMPAEEFASARVIQGEPSALNVEMGIVKEDGSVVWISVSAAAVPFSDWSAVIVTQDITAKKQAEQALQASQQNLAALIENTDASIWSVDAQYRMIVGNQLYHRNVSAAIGRSLLPGENVLSLNLPPTALNEWRGYYDRALGGEMFSIETSTHFATEVQTVEYRFNPIRTLEGQITGVTVFGRDITERKRAETALRQSEEKYAILFHKAVIPAVLTPLPSGVYEDVNEAFEKIFGYSRQEAIGKTSLELGLVRPESRAATIVKLQQQGWVQGDEKIVHTKSGEIRIVLINVGKVEFNDQEYAITTIQDITERKRAEEALRRSEARYRLISENTADVIWVLDPYTKRFTYVSPSVEKLRGYTPAEVMAQPVSEAMTPASLQKVSESLAVNLPQFIAQGSGTMSFINEVDQPRKDGSIVNTEVTTTYLFDEHRQVEIVGVSRDITARKRAEEELHRTLEELRRSNAELEQFAYVASHDLQEPLRAVAGMVQLLQQKYQGQLDEDADEYIELAVEGANRMQTLINDLLAYSRVGRRSKPFEPVSAKNCLQQALRNLEVTISESQATITYDNLPTVTADSTQLAQLFQNLVSNGLKFRGEQSPQIHISARQVEQAWQFSVRDNGIGIEPQYFERIFLVFQRLHLREEYPGTGIGLAVCQKIIERHSGRIWVESQPGQGSTFYFTLPR